MILRATGSGKSVANIKVGILIGELETRSSCQTDITSSQGNMAVPVYESHLWISDSITHLETNLDDITGENLAFVVELLLQNGAIDAWVTAIVMKKGRPAHTLHTLCRSGSVQHEETVKSLLELIFRHTTTLGVRIYRDLPRAKLSRSMVTVQTPYRDTNRNGLVDVKVSKFKNGEIVSMKAEFDHCKQISHETGVPLKYVSESAISSARNQAEPDQSGTE
jgi:uncharacterized protein (DUF111 family)